MKRKGVVWVSTVLYVLIGLAIISTLLAVLRPKIAETRDAFLIDQTVQGFNTLDDTIFRVREATGNRFLYTLNLDKGTFYIDAINQKIYWNMDSSYQYSEENKTISEGRIDALTTKISEKVWNVNLALDYSQERVDFTINGAKKIQPLSKADLPYKVWISNNGTNIAQGIQYLVFEIE